MTISQCVFFLSKTELATGYQSVPDNKLKNFLNKFAMYIIWFKI